MLIIIPHYELRIETGGYYEHQEICRLGVYGGFDAEEVERVGVGESDYRQALERGGLGRFMERFRRFG